MNEQQAKELINAIEELTLTINSVFAKGDCGYTIGDSLEAIAIEQYNRINKKVIAKT